MPYYEEHFGGINFNPRCSRDAFKVVAFCFSSGIHFVRSSEPDGASLMCNLGRGQYLKHTFEITLNLDQWFWKKCRLKIVFFFSILSFGGHFIWHSGTFCII